MNSMEAIVFFNDNKKFPLKFIPKNKKVKLPKTKKHEILFFENKVLYLINGGKKKKYSISNFQTNLKEIYEKANSLSIKNIKLRGDFKNINFSPDFEAHYFFELLNWKFSRKKDKEKSLKLSFKKNLDALKLSSIVNSSRELVSLPPAELNPETIEEHIKENFSDFNLKVYRKKELENMGMGGILSVGKGGSKEPRLIILHYKPKNSKLKIGLVGKTVTFDSGGYNLKPGSAMLDMKIDMAGGATVLAVARAIKDFNLPVEVKVFIPAVENLINEFAYKPGDIIKTYSGKTVEITNTDAEGRLILADALSFADEEKFDYIFDYATLTGAAIVALGDEVSALMSYNDALSKAILDSFSRVNEPIWRLPMYDFYRKDIKSDIADLKNAGYGNGGGTLKAGLFLSEFVKKNKKVWAHFDIAGPVYFSKKNRLGLSLATGYGIRGTIEFLKKLTAPEGKI